MLKMRYTIRNPRGFTFTRTIPFMSLKIAWALAFAFLIVPISNFAVSARPIIDGAGIQAALDNLPEGGEVVLGVGRYLIRQPIVLQKSRQALRGCGAGTVLFLADGADCPVVILGAPSANSRKSVKGVRLVDLWIDGNRMNQPKEVWKFLPNGPGIYNNGVDVRAVDDATVENVVCCHCRSGGMVTSARTRRLTVRDYTAFDNQYDGLACYLTEDSHFSRLNLHDNLAAGISLDLDFNHNVIDDTVLTGNDLGIFMRQSRNNVFEGLTIKKSRHHGVFMAQTVLGKTPCPGSECAGNSFDNIQITNCGGKAFLVNDADCTNNVISGEQFSGNAQGGLAQAAPNLVAMRVVPAAHSQSAVLGAILPGVR
jgi:hypothetical protein